MAGETPDIIRCPRCNGLKEITVAVCYPNPPARLFRERCPFCAGRGRVASEAEAQQLTAQLADTLLEAKREVPWLRRRAEFGHLRSKGATEFVIMAKGW